MLSDFINQINEKYPLTFREELRTRAGGMDYIIKSFYAPGLGSVSTMEVVGFLGLMRMDTFIINPFEVDVPLLSYDFVSAFGNISLYLEIFETRIDRSDVPAYIKDLGSLNDKFSFVVKDNWYRDILYPQSLHLKAKKKYVQDFNDRSKTFLGSYLSWCEVANKCDVDIKRLEARKYTEGLLEHGGPSTDFFIKKKGREFTENLFRNILFLTK